LSNKKDDIQSEAPEELEAEQAKQDVEPDTKEEEAVEVDPLQAAQEEIAELKDKLLRQHAEAENMRKRTERQVAEAHKYAIEKFAVSLLDVVDNLERAIEVEEGNEKALREGITLTLDSWHKVANKFHLERIDAVGQAFDPHFHEALSKVPSDEPEDTVIAQHVAGYTLNDRLIRPAKVLVSSGKG
jgi:molecular chaperone GrpE